MLKNSASGQYTQRFPTSQTQDFPFKAAEFRAKLPSVIEDFYAEFLNEFLSDSPIFANPFNTCLR